MSSPDTIIIPPQLAVLPLPYPFVLHPSLLLSIPLSYAHSLSLLKAALQTAAADESGANVRRGASDAKERPIIVACLPTLQAPEGAHARPTPASQQRGVVPYSNGNKVIGSSSVANEKARSTLQPGEVRINDLAEWGCAARLLRLTRHPASQTCTLLVTGLARIRVDRFLSSRVNVTLAGSALGEGGRIRDLEGNNNATSAPVVTDVGVPLASVTVFAEGVDPYLPVPMGPGAPNGGGATRRPLGQESGDALLIRELRASANDILDALSSLPIFSSNGNPSNAPNTILPISLTSSQGNNSLGNVSGGGAFGAGGMPLLPPVMLKRLRTLVKDAPDSAMGTLADVLVGTLGGACEWAARLDLLSEWDVRSRLSAATKALRNGASRILLARELVSALAVPLNQGSKETLLRQQLESLLTSLVAINPNVSARITTPNGGFSINGSAINNNSSSNGSSSSSAAVGPDGKPRPVITIRGGTGPNSDAARFISSLRNGNPFKGGQGGNPFDGSGRSGGPGGPGGEDNAEADEVAELAAKLEKAQLSPEARKACEKELKRLQRIPQQSVERGVVITYLELMAELPWEKTSSDLSEEEMQKVMQRGAHVDEALEAQRSADEGIVERARRILDEDHYGLEKIKKRLVEYLAVLELKTIQAEERLELELKIENEKALVKKGDGSSGPAGDAAASDPASISEDFKGFGQMVRIEEDPSEPSKASNNDANASDDAAEEQRRNAQREMERRAKRKANVADKGPILLLVGPPGTGKTSIAKSLATALRRPFTRLSLGGVRDEAEIRGHRRTYVGAMPGSIVSSLRKVGVSDPVILLDEVDKLGSGNGLHGDPMAAMLEVLDPEQNHSFNDHYVNTPIDLSKVLFIATANSLDTISPPLLDRTEVIQVSGYTYDEKVAIAKQYLLPKQVKMQGLKPEHIRVSDDVLLKVAMSYTREAGVRTLERQIGALARAKAVEFAEVKKGAKDKDGKEKVYDPEVRLDQLEKLLGIETYEPEVAELQSRPGVSTGLAYQGSGSGGILHIESILLPPGNGGLKLTGSLGDVIRESAELAFSWVKAHAFQLGITASRDSEFPKNDVHLHLPSGAIPKDGPSAGVAMTCALVSLFTRTPISPKLAMTGEITLRGQVTPVGGIKEKCIGAHRAGITKVMLPARNRKDIEADLPANVKSELQVVYIKTIWQALEHAFGHALFEHAAGSREGIEEGRKMMFEIEGSRL